MFVALARKGTGNTYNAVTLTVFGLIGLLFAFLLPWLLAMGTSEVFRGAFRGVKGTIVVVTDTGRQFLKSRQRGPSPKPALLLRAS